MNLRDKLFGFQGRIGRADFWALSICIGLFQLCLGFAVSAATGRGLDAPASDPTTTIGLLALTLWPSLAVRVKRGHDRNRPAAWSIAVFLAAAGLSMLTPHVGVPAAGAQLSGVATGAGILLMLYVLIDFALWPGNATSNNYGPPTNSYDLDLDTQARAAREPKR